MQTATDNLSIQALAGLAENTYSSNAILPVGTNSGGFVLLQRLDIPPLIGGLSSAHADIWGNGQGTTVVALRGTDPSDMQDRTANTSILAGSVSQSAKDALAWAQGEINNGILTVET